MDNTTLARERNRATGQLVFLVFFAVLGSVLMAAGVLGFERFAFSFSQYATFTGVGFIIIVTTGLPASFVLDTLRITGDDDRPLQAEANDASDMLTFDNTQTLPAIEVTDGNTIRLGKYKPDYGTWGDLADALHDFHWEWSRDRALARSGCFKNLTAVYGEMTRDMLRIGIIEGRRNHYRVSLDGQQFFVEQSDNLFLENIST